MLASCQESREEAMLRLVNEWNGKEIKFPARSVFTIQGKDTVDLEFGNSDYKVVTCPFLVLLSSEGYEGTALLDPSGRFHLSRVL